ncbi:WbqC family protein [Solibacillus sp. FSL H8-0538]|uniref:WbqC family protein n=1 Tax=Solibacillus sp. FSL H8-0538 TaxID=2921400 RepID=UPI0030F648A3
MKIAIHQPNYLPWIGYFDKLEQVDQFVLLDKAVHSKSGFIHRNKIKTPNGPLVLTVPLKNKEQPINELQIANNVNWPVSHWKAIEANYKKCPYWATYKDGFEQLYRSKWENVATLNITLIKHINALLNITTKILLESDFELDFGNGNTRNVNIVSHLGGDVYLSGVGARVYNDIREFHDNQIELVYQDFKHPEYPQRFGDFQPNLSIIDMLFNCGPETMEMIRKQRR